MQTFSKMNRTEVRSTIAVYLKEHSKEAMNDCQPKVENKMKLGEIPHKNTSFKMKPESNVNQTECSVSVSYAGAVLAEKIK